MISVVEAGDERNELPAFTPIVTEWMRRAFEAPTQAQCAAWPVIAEGRNTLVFSPTGSGKTLAAFLWAIDELVSLGNRSSLPDQPYVVYISPLRALANDVEKNLLAPLREMKDTSEQQGVPFPDIRVGVRTGDTLPEERQKMLRRPPHILITTPESLYLLLTSSFRDHLRSVRYAIVDEIHHLCGNKRGAHLAISLERLEELALRRSARESAAGQPTKGFVRIGLSATQSPVQDIARFLVGCEDDGVERDCTVVDLGVRRDMDVQVVTAVPNLVEAKPEEIWDAIHEQLYDLILSHRTTLIFCNSRHLTERVAAKLNMLAEARGGGPRIGAHHGSMSRVLRLEMEEGLKSGALRAVVATSSLELGIDIGHLDLVCQVESPKSVAAGLQRVGRAGHLLGLTSKGRMFATTRDDLVELAVLAKAMCEGSLEPVHIPLNCLDVAAQQAAAMAAVEGGSPGDMLRIIRRAYSFRSLPEDSFAAILEQLSGRSGDRELFEARTVVNWDRADDRTTGARGALGLILQNAGTIPETAEYSVHAEDYQKKLGTLDERFVQRLRPGRIFVLGTRTWEFLRVDRNRVYVRDSRGRAPTIPRWAGLDDVPRSFQLGEQIARFRSTMFSRLFDQPEGLQSWLMDEHLLDEPGAQQIIQYFVEQAHSLDTWPGRDTIVAETSRNPLGHQQVLVHSPYGARLNEAWAEALAQAAQHSLQAELQVVYSDNAFALYLPRECGASAADVLALVTSDDLGRWIDSYVRQSALFSIKFRHAAVRSLAVPRMIAGKKRPIWQQDAIAKRLEREVEDLPLFPLTAETVREATEDHLDLSSLRRLLDDLASGRTRLVATEVQVPSPFGHELLLAGQFGAMGEMNRRERRAELLSLHREVLKQILDEKSIRDLLSPKVVEAFEARRQGTLATTQARDAEELLRLIRRSGDLSDSPDSGLFIGHRAGADWAEWLDALRRERRAVPIIIPRPAGDERRWIAAEDYLVYARAFAADPPDGAPCDSVLQAIRSPEETSTREVERVVGEEAVGLLDALERAYAIVRSREEDGQAYWAIPEQWLPGLRPEKISRRAARQRILLRALRVAGPLAVEDLAHRYGLTQKATAAALRGLVETDEAQQGSFVRGRATPQVCTTANLEELHRRALAALRREVEPIGLGRYVDFLLKWQHAHPKSKLEGAEGIRTVMAQQAGYRAYPRVWEREIIGLRVRDADRRGIVSAVSSGEVRAGQFNLGETRSRPLLAATTFLPDERAAQFLEVPSTEHCSADEIAVLRLLRTQGDMPAAQIASGTSLAETDVELALWHLFRSGLVSNTDYSAIARCTWTSAPRWESALFGGPDASEESAAPDSDSDADGDDADLRRAGLRAAQGDWYAVRSIADLAQDDDALSRRRRARVMALMQRYGVAAREVLLAKSDMSTQDVSRGLRELFLRGQLLRGFFVRSLSGDQFALPDALEGLRKEAPAKSEPALMVSSIDPAAVHLTAAKLPGMQNRPLATRYLVLHRGDLEAIVDRHAGEARFLRVRDLRLFHPTGASRPQRSALHKRVATAILEYAIRWGAWEAVRISHVNGDPVYEKTEFAGDLAEAGFRLVRGELSYRLRKRVGAADETAMRRIVKTEEQKREDVRLTSKPVLDFYHHIISEYTPPPDKDMLVVFQCSVSRPFSKSPSHSSMRKAIRLATGKDPRDDFEDCRCHVVVLASMIGPVPYEMETVYPADERGGGVKHMSDYEYHLAKPILAKRMAAYLRRWHDRYKVITTFTHGRYGDVMREARKLARLDFAILPDASGVRLKLGNQYWTRYWIQVFFKLLEGMTGAERAEAMARLDREGVAIDDRSGPRRPGGTRRR